jgi:hypothetical protein
MNSLDPKDRETGLAVYFAGSRERRSVRTHSFFARVKANEMFADVIRVASMRCLQI